MQKTARPAMGWKSLGKVICGHVTQPGDIDGRPELQDADTLGRSMKQTGRMICI